MRHTKTGVRLRWTRVDRRRPDAGRGVLGHPRSPLFNPAVRALLAAIAATALTAATADAKTTSTPASWSTQQVERGFTSMLAVQIPFFAKNVSVDSVRCATGGSRRWTCIVRVRSHGRLDPMKYGYTVWIDRSTSRLNAHAIN